MQVKKLSSDSLVVIGVVQEQHAERTQLYKQWRQFDFEIVQDPMTKLGLDAVPMFIGIDEHGVVRKTKWRPNDLPAFVKTEFPKPEELGDVADLAAHVELQKPTDVADKGADLSERELVDRWVRWGDKEILFGDQPENIENAIEAYSLAIEKQPNEEKHKFRLGVAYRKKYDEAQQADEDFDLASDNWAAALSARPNQYIWRRRIEQYGPKMAKPYPFYDWVETAIEEITARGEEPVKLTVPLTRSERSGRTRNGFDTASENPDEQDQITHDNEFVVIESTIVPGKVVAGKPATAHVTLRPNGAKWNNESTPLRLWLESTDAQLVEKLVVFENPSSIESAENRRMEFDFLVKKESSECTVRGFALYNVCLEDGTCVYRRQDFELNVPLLAPQPRRRRN